MLLEGALLAIVVVWFFLRDMRATLISASALPLSVIPTFWALYIFGFSMNTLTMLALSLVVGMLVDDAIVEVENNVRHLRMGKPPMQAATDAAIEIGLAVVATSLTLCAVFVPVAFMDGIRGEFFKPFAFTATVAVLFSLLVARTLTPMMASRFMRAEHGTGAAGRFKTWYLDKVDWVLRASLESPSRASTVLMVGALLARRHAAHRSSQPAQDCRLGEPQRQPAAGLHHGRIRAVADEMPAAGEEFIRKSAASPPTVRAACAPASRSSTAPSRSARQQQLQAADDCADLRAIPGVRIQSGGNTGGGPGGGPVQLTLTGDDSAVLATTAANVERELRRCRACPTSPPAPACCSRNWSSGPLPPRARGTRRHHRGASAPPPASPPAATSR